MIRYLGIIIFIVGLYSLIQKKRIIKNGGVSNTKSWLCVLGMVLGFILIFGSNFHANITVGDKEIYSVGEDSGDEEESNIAVEEETESYESEEETEDDSVCGGVIEESIYDEDPTLDVPVDQSFVDSTSNQSLTFHTMDGTPITIHPSSDFKVTSAEYCTILSSDKLEAGYTESCLYNEDSTIEDILSEYNKVYHIDLKQEECNGKAVYMGSYMTDYDAHKLIVVQDTGEGHLIQIDITDYDKAIDDIDLFNMFGLSF